MPSSVLVSSKHCSIAQRKPLSHTSLAKSTLSGAIGHKIGIRRFRLNCSVNQQPGSLPRHAVTRDCNPSFGNLIHDLPLGTLGDCSSIPEKIVDPRGKGFNGERRFDLVGNQLFRMLSATALIALLNGGRVFEPT